jgi:hypothetical protein
LTPFIELYSSLSLSQSRIIRDSLTLSVSSHSIYFMINFNCVFLSYPNSHIGYFSFGCFYHKFKNIPLPHLFYICYISCPSNIPWFYKVIIFGKGYERDSSKLYKFIYFHVTIFVVGPLSLLRTSCGTECKTTVLNNVTCLLKFRML